MFMITFYLLMQINTYTKVCSEHFLPDCLVKTKTGITKLKPGAVPTVFAMHGVLSDQRGVLLELQGSIKMS